MLSWLIRLGSMLEDVQNQWGDYASLGGLVVSLIGFGLTLVALFRATRHFDRAVALVSSIDTLSSFEVLSSSIELSIKHCESDEWSELKAECARMRLLLVTLLSSESLVKSEARTKLRMVQAEVISIHEGVQTFSMNQSSKRPFGYKQIARKLSDQRDVMAEIVMMFKSKQIKEGRSK